MIHQTFKGLGRFLNKNSTSILMGVTMAGVITTPIFAIEATITATKILNELENKEDLSELEKLQAVWKCYIWTAISGAITFGSVIAVNSIHQRRNATIAGLYSLAQTTLTEYRDKVVEIIGENKERKIRDSVDADKVLNGPGSTVIITGTGDVLCYDSLTGRYFTSDIEKIRQIVNELNHSLLTEMFVSLNDLFFELGLEGTELGKDMGFDIERGLLDMKFSSQLTKDGKPCLVLNYQVYPKYSR